MTVRARGAGPRAWVGDEEGRMYLLEARGGSLVIYGPVPSTAAHLPELSLVVYAAVAFGSIALGFPWAAVAAMIAAAVGVPLVAVAVKRHYIKGEGARADVRASEPLGGRLLRLTVDVEGVGRVVLYANSKDLAGWALPAGGPSKDK